MKQKPFDIHDNTYLCSLDMTHATKTQKIAWLTMIIDNESERGEHMDEQLVWECAEHLEQLSPEVAMSAKERDTQLRAFLSAYGTPAAPQPHATILPSPIRTSNKIHNLLIRIAAIASVFLMIAVLSPQVYARALVERDNRLYHDAVTRDFLNAETTPPELQSIGSFASPYEVTYSDLSSFLRDHSYLDFYYPLDLPAEQAIQSVSVIYHSEKSWIIVFSFQNPDMKNFVIQRLSQPAHMIEEQQTEKYFSTGKQKYAISQKEEGEKTVFTAQCVSDGLRYTAEAYDYNTMRLVLSKTNTYVYNSYSSMEEFLAKHDYLPEFLYPKQLPEGFLFHTVRLSYRSSADWTVIIHYKHAQSPGNTHILTISPINDQTSVDLGSDPPVLSNEIADIYLTSTGLTSTYGHYNAICVVGNLKYTMRIFGYEPFIAFSEALFGTFG